MEEIEVWQSRCQKCDMNLYLMLCISRQTETQNYVNYKEQRMQVENLKNMRSRKTGDLSETQCNANTKQIIRYFTDC